MTDPRLPCLLALVLASGPALAAGFDINGVALGGAEADVYKAFPSARCKALEWKSDSADRRCDDAKVVVAGVAAKITVYLRRDSIQAFDLRFDAKDVARVTGQLKSNWGKPATEGRDKVYKGGKESREVYKVAWQQGKDRAVLTSVSTANRASLSASRGNFEEEIYRVK